MKNKTIAFKTKLFLIILPFLIIILASIYSTNNLLSDLTELTVKSVEGMKSSTLVLNGKDLEATFHSISYQGKDAIYKRQLNEDSAAENFVSELEIFDGQLSQFTGQLSSMKKDKEAEEMKSAYAPVRDAFQKWAEKVNSKAITADQANTEFKSIRKNLKEFIKTVTSFQADDSSSVEGIFSFVSKAKEKFKILNWAFILISIIVLIAAVILLMKMNKLLNTIIEDLKAQFDKLNDLSASLSKQSAELGGATQQQAASLQETVSTMEEMTAMVKKNTEAAESSRQAVDENNSMTKSGVESVDSMVQSINQVKSVTDELPDVVERSGAELKKIIDVINEINNKTKVINDIVFQTKLLSFNASVEAARAGENGKGFSVVAEEVGKLAELSGTSAKEIAELLESSSRIVAESIENNKGSFIKSSSDINVRVNESFGKASECNHILTSIETKANSISSMINEITLASKEQFHGIEEINEALIQLDKVSHQNSAVAAETAKVGTNLQENALAVESILEELIVFLRGSSGNDKNLTG